MRFLPFFIVNVHKLFLVLLCPLGVTVMPEGFREDGVVLAHLDGFDFSRDIGLVFAAHADAEALRHGWLATSLARAVEPPAPD